MTDGNELRLLIRLSGANYDNEEIIVGRQGLRVGRGGDNLNLTLNHPEISRSHIRIIWTENDTYLVEDTNSRNGTWLNNDRLVSRVPAELNLGDVIRIGPFTLRVEQFIYEPIKSLVPATTGGDGASVAGVQNGQKNYRLERAIGYTHQQSNWLEYLPAIYGEDEFMGRYLLIFETIFNPIVWMIDHFDMYLSPDVAPVEWLQWMAGWFDLLLLPDLPIERQRRIMNQAGWLFLRRGTPAGLKRLLELYFGVTPEIDEQENCHFVVTLALSQKNAETAKRLIQSQKPAFASFELKLLPPS